MADALYLLLTIVAFAAATGLVSACDRIVGPDGGTGTDGGGAGSFPEEATLGAEAPR